jgi:hypothetical protein
LVELAPNGQGLGQFDEHRKAGFDMLEVRRTAVHGHDGGGAFGKNRTQFPRPLVVEVGWRVPPVGIECRDDGKAHRLFRRRPRHTEDGIEKLRLHRCQVGSGREGVYDTERNYAATRGVYASHQQFAVLLHG